MTPARRIRHLAVTALTAAVVLRGAPALAACQPSAKRLCLLEGRFSTTLRWDDGSGFKDALVAEPKTDGSASASGLFYFYENDPSNWEILTKMIDGCDNNGSFWVLTAASTGFAWELSIKDEATGATKKFTHPLDGQASGISDFGAFKTCGSTPPPTPTPNPGACPANGPLTDLRRDCSDYIYFYISPNRLVGAGYSSDGTIVASCISNGDATICAGGPVISATKADLVAANSDGGPLLPLDAGSYLEIRNSGQLLDLRLKLDGDRYDFFGFQYFDTDPLLVVGEAALSAIDPRVSNVRQGLDNYLGGAALLNGSRSDIAAGLTRLR